MLSSAFNTTLAFDIDGTQLSTFTCNSTNISNTTLSYNVLVYSNTDLLHQQHTLEIHNGLGGSSSSLMLLDYVVFTYIPSLGFACSSRLLSLIPSLTQARYIPGPPSNYKLCCVHRVTLRPYSDGYRAIQLCGP